MNIKHTRAACTRNEGSVRVARPSNYPGSSTTLLYDPQGTALNEN